MVSAGVVDQDYTGNIGILLFNHGENTVTLEAGECIAQLVPECYYTGVLKEVNQIHDTEQGTGGFRSTDTHESCNTETGCGPNCPCAIRPCPDDKSEYACAMEPKLVKIFTIDLMPTTTDEALHKMIPPEYHDYLDVFDPKGPTQQLPPLRPSYNFKIWLDPNKLLPKPAHPYHMSPAECEDWIKWCDTMLAAGLIAPAPANTPVATPFFFVWKKDGTRRPIIDYHKLNNITIKDSYPLPHIDEMLERMQGAKIFSKFDLKMGYNQLRIKPEDVWKTTFMTPDSPYVMLVMTFSFANAPAYFQQWMSDTLTPMIPHRVENYLDDTGSHHLTIEEHIEVNCGILERFCQAGLFANAKKCKFHQESLQFLRVEVSLKGFEMEKVKVDMVEKWVAPSNVRQVREFIGICNFYRRFIRSFSEIARPLHNLMKVGKQWQWTEQEQNAFQTLKDMICASPVLIHVDPAARFVMETDASSYTYGTILSQKGDDGKFHPVAFYSKSMTPAKRNYRISDKEALAIIKALQHWRHWLEGTQEPVHIITDHRNLEYFKNPHPLNRHQLCWLEQLTHFNYEIAYCPSNQNCAADALSHTPNLMPDEPDTTRPETLFPAKCFIDLAAADIPTTLESNEYVTTCMDTQLLKEISRLTRTLDPLAWPPGYELNDNLVLASNETGCIWVLENNDLCCEVVASHHDGKSLDTWVPRVHWNW